MVETISTAVVVAFALAAPATAATLNGTFNVDIDQRADTNAAQADATLRNVVAATKAGSVTYTGDLDFGTVFSNGSTMIGSWLAIGNLGSFVLKTAETVGFLDLKLRQDDINANSATALTTVFHITATFAQGSTASSPMTTASRCSTTASRSRHRPPRRRSWRPTRRAAMAARSV